MDEMEREREEICTPMDEMEREEICTLMDDMESGRRYVHSWMRWRERGDIFFFKVIFP